MTISRANVPVSLHDVNSTSDTGLHANMIQTAAPSVEMKTNERSVRSVLNALNEGSISEAVQQFDERFTFIDHALNLEFTESDRLTEFFQKSRELFPDSMVEVESTLQCEDHVIAQWKLTGTQTLAGNGNLRRSVRIVVQGVSIVQIENNRIVKWSDYYDATRSWRFNLAEHLTGWVEY